MIHDNDYYYSYVDKNNTIPRLINFDVLQVSFYTIAPWRLVNTVPEFDSAYLDSAIYILYHPGVHVYTIMTLCDQLDSESTL